MLLGPLVRSLLLATLPLSLALAQAQPPVQFRPLTKRWMPTQSDDAIYAYDLTLADVDGDGDPDYIAGSGTCVTLRLNDGTGLFGRSSCVEIGHAVSDVDAADLDGDGDVDLAVACDTDQLVIVLPNLGGGTFGEGADVASPSGADELVIGDVDGDCVPDVVASTFSGGSINVFIGLGERELDEAMELPVGGSVFNPLIDDVDGDGDLDILAKRVAGGGDVPAVWLRNEGDSVFARPFVLAGTESAGDMAATDLTGDGLVDLATSDYGQPRFHVSLNVCEPPAIVGDVDGDRIVDGADLGALLAAWGRCAACDVVACPADLDGSCVVDGTDLGVVVASWTACGG